MCNSIATSKKILITLGPQNQNSINEINKIKEFLKIQEIINLDTSNLPIPFSILPTTEKSKIFLKYINSLLKDENNIIYIFITKQDDVNTLVTYKLLKTQASDEPYKNLYLLFLVPPHVGKPEIFYIKYL